MMDEIIGAVYRADLEALSRLLNSESVAWVDADGRTALMHALLADDVSPSVVEFLLRAGVPPDVQDTAGQAWTALHFAARRQRPDLVKLLLQNGASVDAVDSYGNTPLWRAVMSAKDDDDTVQALLQGGANPTVANKAGVSPLELAERAGKVELSQVLRSHSPEPNGELLISTNAKIDNELSLPPQITGNPEASEILRVWTTGDTQAFVIRANVWNDPAAWGILLVDLARHLANSYTATDGDYQQVVARIRAGFDSEWEAPTE